MKRQAYERCFYAKSHHSYKIIIFYYVISVIWDIKFFNFTKIKEKIIFFYINFYYKLPLFIDDLVYVNRKMDERNIFIFYMFIKLNSIFDTLTPFL